MPRFDRTYRLLVGQESGVEIVPPVRLTFRVHKDTDEQSNHHTVRVWNLAPDTVKEMQKPDTRCVLYAGYREEDQSLKYMASGDLVYAYSYHQGADTITKLDFLDGRIAIRDTTVSLKYDSGVKASKIIKYIAGQMGLPLVMPSDAPDRTWANGFSFMGAAHTALHKVTRATGLQWSIQNGKLQVIAEGMTTPGTGFVISADSGMLGSPKRTRRGAHNKAIVKDQATGKNETILMKAQERDGWQVDSLLLPTVNPGDRVKIESDAITDWFKVQAVLHVGDYTGGQWKTTLQVTTYEHG